MTTINFTDEMRAVLLNGLMLDDGAKTQAMKKVEQLEAEVAKVTKALEEERKRMERIPNTKEELEAVALNMAHILLTQIPDMPLKSINSILIKQYSSKAKPVVDGTAEKKPHKISFNDEQMQMVMHLIQDAGPNGIARTELEAKFVELYPLDKDNDAEKVRINLLNFIKNQIAEQKITQIGQSRGTKYAAVSQQ